MSVRLTAVSKTFDNGLKAIETVTFNAEKGEFIALLGASGCGKSTLLRMIAGLDTQSSGEITAENDAGFVFQDATLLEWRSVFDNIYLPLQIKGVSRADAKPLVESEIARMKLDGFADAKPKALSGGMKMRVSIARALVTKPQLLLLDEPFAALDEITRFQLNEELRLLQITLNTTVIFVTHSIYEAVNLASRIVILSPRPALVKGIITNDTVKDGNYKHTSEFSAKVKAVSALLEA